MKLSITIQTIIDSPNLSNLEDNKIYSIGELVKLFPPIKHYTLYTWLKPIVSYLGNGNKRNGRCYVTGKKFKQFIEDLRNK